MCKWAFTWCNSPSAHTLERYVFQSCSYRTYIAFHHKKSSPLRAGWFNLHTTPWCTGRGQAATSCDLAWNFHSCEGMVLATSSEPWAHSLLPGRSAGKGTATQAFQGNPHQCLLCLCLPLSVQQGVSWTLLFRHGNTGCCIGQSSHVLLRVERFSSPLLTSSLISSLTGYAASSGFVATSWVKASGRWWA